MIAEERQRLLDDYAATSRAFADAIGRLREANADLEALIRALAEAGTARRACERSRIRLEKYVSLR